MSLYFLMILVSFDTRVYGFLTKVNDVNIRYTVSRYGTYINAPASSRLVSISEVSVSECLYQCVIRPNCEGLNYWGKFPLCELVSGNGVLESSANCLYIKRSEIGTENVPCSQQCDGEQLCNQDGQCIVKENLECPYPVVAYGKLSGNMFSVDDTQALDCISGYSVHGVNRLKCMENGTWDTIPECRKDCDVTVFHDADVKTFTNVSGSYANVKCHTDYISDRTTSDSNLITEETVGCSSNANWSPTIDCTYIGNLYNVALNKPTFQSTTYGGAVSSRATDGIWNPDYWSPGACTHTKEGVEDVAWWKVDLQHTFTIRRLKILNRLENYFSGRFRNVTITVGTHPNPTEICAVYDGPATSGEISELICNQPITGQFVQLTKPNIGPSTNIAVCEVAVYEN